MQTCVTAQIYYLHYRFGQEPNFNYNWRFNYQLGPIYKFRPKRNEIVTRLSGGTFQPISYLICSKGFSTQCCHYFTSVGSEKIYGTNRAIISSIIIQILPLINFRLCVIDAHTVTKHPSIYLWFNVIFFPFSRYDIFIIVSTKYVKNSVFGAVDFLLVLVCAHSQTWTMSVNIKYLISFGGHQ